MLYTDVWSGWLVFWGGRLTATTTSLYHRFSIINIQWVIWFNEVNLDKKIDLQPKWINSYSLQVTVLHFKENLEPCHTIKSTPHHWPDNEDINCKENYTFDQDINRSSLAAKWLVVELPMTTRSWNMSFFIYSRFHLVVQRWRNPYFKSFWF